MYLTVVMGRGGQRQVGGGGANKRKLISLCVPTDLRPRSANNILYKIATVSLRVPSEFGIETILLPDLRPIPPCRASLHHDFLTGQVASLRVFEIGYCELQKMPVTST